MATLKIIGRNGEFRALAFALQTAYRSLGFGFLAFACYLVAITTGYWPSATLTQFFCIAACLLCSPACLFLEFKFRSWGIRGKFWLIAAVQLIALAATLPLASTNDLYWGIGIAGYFLGAYGFHDGMRVPKERMRVPTGLDKQIAASDSRYDPRRDYLLIHGLVLIETMVYVTGSFILANRMAKSLFDRAKRSGEQLPKNLLEYHRIDLSKDGHTKTAGILHSIWDFGGLVSATLAFVALCYFFTGREAIFSETERTIYLWMLGISVSVYMLSRLASKSQVFSIGVFCTVSLTLLIFWGYVASDRLQGHLVTWDELQCTPGFNCSRGKKTSTLVGSAQSIVEHFPPARQEITAKKRNRVSRLSEYSRV